MATPYQIRQLQRGINKQNDDFSLGQGHLPVDSIYGPRTAEESRWMQWVALGMKPDNIGHYGIDFVIWAFFHRTQYFVTRPAAYRRHRANLAAIRGGASSGGHHLAEYRGLKLVTWIKPKMVAHNMDYGIPGDQFCGWRGPVGSGLQAYLYKRFLAHVEPGPVAPPGNSMHEYCDCPWCRQKIADRFGISTSDAIGGAVDAQDPYELSDNDLAPAGSSDPPHASSRRYQNASGRY